MNYANLDIMTRGTGDTELEPSEEFPILFGLLTAPMTSSGGGGGSLSKPHSYMSKYSLSKIPQIEADSSALSDDSCISDDDTSTSSVFSDSMDEDSMDTNIESNSNEAVSSSPKNTLEFYPNGKKGEDIEDTDAFPTSTTVDDEDFDDLMVSRSRHGSLDIFNSNNNRARDRSRTLKRSYDQMIQGSLKESRSSMQLVHATRNSNNNNNSDSEDDHDHDEIEDYCLAENGIQQRLSLFQLNKLVSYASAVSPLLLAEKRNNLCSQSESQSEAHCLPHAKSQSHQSNLPTNRPHLLQSINTSAVTTNVLPTKQLIDPENYCNMSATRHPHQDRHDLLFSQPSQNLHNLSPSKKSGLAESRSWSNCSGRNVNVINANESSFTSWCTNYLNINSAHLQRTADTDNGTTHASAAITNGNQNKNQIRPNGNGFADEEPPLQLDKSFKIKQSSSNNDTISDTTVQQLKQKQQPIDIEAKSKDVDDANYIAQSMLSCQNQDSHEAYTSINTNTNNNVTKDSQRHQHSPNGSIPTEKN